MDKVLQSTELLKTRSIDDKVNFDAFIQYYKQSPPPIYKIFMETYDVGRDKRKGVGVYIDSEDHVYNIVTMRYKGNAEDYIGLYDLLSIEESIQAMENAFEEEDEIYNMNLVPFGECFDNMLLMVGTGADNLDKVYLENTSHFKGDKRFLFVADHVFEFIQRLYYEKNKARKFFGVEDYSEFYKNWGEDFWRIKGS